MTDGTKLLSAIHTAFQRIGTRNGHAFPEQSVDTSGTTSNSEVERIFYEERAAFEYMVAGELKSAAEKRHKEAERQVEDLGLLDEIDKVQPGQSATLYQGSIVNISVSVNNPTTRVDTTQLKNELRKRGVAQETIDNAVRAATMENRPAKRKKATPVL
jgi:predicted GNAT family acetyltransferase